ncbi:MAG: ribonuclease HII [Candidatus Nealsonbacteria bacterium]|nr:ribonuclease HII [Candidatus Nealsonbacteria bacterium]
MKHPSLQEERKLWKKGYKRVAGLDEAGRGPIAGPVIACAVMIENPKFKALNPKQYQNPKFKCSKHVLNFGHLDLDIISNLGFRILDLKIRDSKKLTPKARERFYRILTTHPGILWGIGRVSEKVIDKINILEATKLAMIKALKNLEKKLKKQKYHIFYNRRKCSIIDILVLDGNFRLNLPLSQKSIIKADEKVFSCAAASIIAKVWRDRIMQRYHKKYPQYGFAQHKGYPTKYHLKMLKKYSPCKIHRKSFKPLKRFTNLAKLR